MLEPEQLGMVLQHTRQLQILDVSWDADIKKLLQVISFSLKELTIRVKPGRNCKAVSVDHIDSFLLHWMSTGFAPQNLTIVNHFPSAIIKPLCNWWVNLLSKSRDAGFTGCIKVYESLNAALSTYPVLPEFQVDLHLKSLPFVKPSSVGLLGLDKMYLNITDCTHGGKVMLTSIDSDIYNKAQLRDNINNLEFVVELVVECGLHSEHLEQLAISCPNLQRLNLKQNTQCLTTLNGLCAITSHCHNLQGLNLIGISVKEIENQLQLWEILSDAKLTHLAVDLCVFLPSVKDEEKLIALLKKCKNLRAFEIASRGCRECAKVTLANNYSILSHFPSLIHGMFSDLFSLYTSLLDILISCVQLKCLIFIESDLVFYNTILPLSAIHLEICNLQQLYIDSYVSGIPNAFMTTISAHGGLVNVVLCVRSVTSEGVTALIENSPKLLMLHVSVYDEIWSDEEETSIPPEQFMANLKQIFFHRKLFKVNGCILKAVDYSIIPLNDTDLFSLWS